MCVKHSNVSFKLAALKRTNVVNVNNNHELLNKVACNTESMECMYGKCGNCESGLEYNLENDKTLQEITWQMWEVQEHTYKKQTNNGEQQIKTKEQ